MKNEAKESIEIEKNYLEIYGSFEGLLCINVIAIKMIDKRQKLLVLKTSL